jgi:hypothetical protein
VFRTEKFFGLPLWTRLSHLSSQAAPSAADLPTLNVLTKARVFSVLFNKRRTDGQACNGSGKHQ